MLRSKNIKGVSLPLVTGLLALLMVSSAAVNQLVIRNLQSIHRIEASNRAYLIAEAGIEDALLELTPHYAGYETPKLETADVRSTEMEPNKWYNEWEIHSKSGQNSWQGIIKAGNKLVIPLFNDNSFRTGSNPKATASKNAINKNPPANTDIQTLNPSDDFSILFQMPPGIITTGKLKIDNDGDYGITLTKNGLNEDGEGGSGSCGTSPEDDDCDGLVDEDSEFDPVILWKLSDGNNRSLIPAKGCIDGFPDRANPKSEICETNFVTEFPVELNESHFGIDQDGNVVSIAEFINHTYNGYSGAAPPNPVTADSNARLHFEFTIVAPMTHIDGTKQKDIPHFIYIVSSNSGAYGTLIPYPHFTIKSDGYYRGFKQSITSTIAPKTTIPLFDFTIIQQE